MRRYCPFWLENRYAGSKSPILVRSFAGPPRKERSRTEGLVWLGLKQDLSDAVDVLLQCGGFDRFVVLQIHEKREVRV